MGVDLNKIAEKIEKGEALTSEEEMEVMGAPNPEEGDELTPEEEEELKGLKYEDDDDDEEEDKDSETSEEDKEKDDDSSQEDDESAIPDKIQAELDKESGQEDLSNFSKREVALYWELRRTRTRAQEAEQERDTLKFRELKRQAQAEVDAEKKKGKEEEDDKDDEDIVTYGDLKKMMKDKKPESDDNNVAEMVFRQRYMQSCYDLAENKLADQGDFEEVLECTEDIISKNPQLQEQVAKAFFEGKENPVVLMYNLIKSSPNFEKVLPIARARLSVANKSNKKPVKEDSKDDLQQKKQKAKETEEKIEKNKKKPLTSAHHKEGVDSVDLGGYTLQQIADMSDLEFSNLPKHVRAKVLTKMGG